MRKFFPLLLFFISAVNVQAQQPFVTDDTDVTEKGKFHFEFSNQFDSLQRSAFPTVKQNVADFEIAYGLFKDVEVSFAASFITLVNDRSNTPRFASGVGDSTFSVKYNFRREREGSKLPAMTVSAFVQIPTGDASRSLGSGITDYGMNFIAQKTFREKNVLRVNAGAVFSGNTQTGVLGITERGVIFTGGVSFVRRFTDKLQLGAEATTAISNNFQLNAGQLQFQFGGNYRIAKNATFDFGLIAGRFAASPRIGLQLGTSIGF